MVRSITWEVDPMGKYTYVSDSVSAVLGYMLSELIGQNIITMSIYQRSVIALSEN